LQGKDSRTRKKKEKRGAQHLFFCSSRNQTVLRKDISIQNICDCTVVLPPRRVKPEMKRGSVSLNYIFHSSIIGSPIPAEPLSLGAGKSGMTQRLLFRIEEMKKEYSPSLF
jgi:hypothetical protein